MCISLPTYRAVSPPTQHYCPTSQYFLKLAKQTSKSDQPSHGAHAAGTASAGGADDDDTHGASNGTRSSHTMSNSRVAAADHGGETTQRDRHSRKLPGREASRKFQNVMAAEMGKEPAPAPAPAPAPGGTAGRKRSRAAPPGVGIQAGTGGMGNSHMIFQDSFTPGTLRGAEVLSSMASPDGHARTGLPHHAAAPAAAAAAGAVPGGLAAISTSSGGSPPAAVPVACEGIVPGELELRVPVSSMLLQSATALADHKPGKQAYLVIRCPRASWGQSLPMGQRQQLHATVAVEDSSFSTPAVCTINATQVVHPQTAKHVV